MKCLEAILTRAIPHSRDLSVSKDLGLGSELSYDFKQFWTLGAHGTWGEVTDGARTQLSSG